MALDGGLSLRRRGPRKQPEGGTGNEKDFVHLSIPFCRKSVADRGNPDDIPTAGPGKPWQSIGRPGSGSLRAAGTL
jgi:hypothetical protein